MDLEKELAAVRAELALKTGDLAVAQKSIETGTASIADVTKKLETKSAEVTDLTGKVKALETERDALVVSEKAHKAAADKATDDLLVRSVEDLVGKKILPAEKDEYVELARSNKALFDKMVGKRADLGLLGEAIVKTDKTLPSTSPGSAENGQGLADAILASETAAA